MFADGPRDAVSIAVESTRSMLDLVVELSKRLNPIPYQGTGIVDPEIIEHENPLVLQVESWDVESHHVVRRDLETVVAVYLETEIAVPVLGNVVLATVDVDLGTGNLGPVTGNDRSPVASEILGFLCPWDVTGDYPDPGSSDIRHRIALPAGQVTES